jgi:nascent polypeptide-associated complex subunit alpha
MHIFFISIAPYNKKGVMMIPGLGGMDPRQMKRLMQQFGIKSEELNVHKATLELEDKCIVIENPTVMVIEAQGQRTYMVVGNEREEPYEHQEKQNIPEEDIELVAEKCNVSPEEAKKALEAADGDIAMAIERIQSEKN